MSIELTATRIALRDATALVLVAMLAFFGLFVALEPSMAIGQVESTFNITMNVDDEIAFVTPPVDVGLTPTPSGITGGTANGSIDVAVRSNATLGYDMTFLASSTDMVNTASSSQTIPGYIPTAFGIPDYTFDTNATNEPAQFAFNVFSTDDPDDVVQLFKHNAGNSTCDSADNNLTNTQCWLNLATTSALTIVDRDSPTPAGGATTTLNFRVFIPNNPDPAVSQGSYRATSTLTITNKN